MTITDHPPSGLTAHRLLRQFPQAISKEAVYDEEGLLTTSTPAEYLAPSTSDVPSVITGQTLAPRPPINMGVPGIGTASTIGAALAVINMIVDALKEFGIRDMPMPASPHTVWKALNAASGGSK